MKFDDSGLKPLDGSPMMSNNCWNTILSVADKHLESGQTPSFLEWGAGNSTIGLVRKGLASKNGLKFVSVEHETNFFHWLAESVLAEMQQDNGPVEVQMIWSPLNGPYIPLSKIGSYRKRHSDLRSYVSNLQIVLNSKRLVYIEGIIPQLQMSPFKIVRNLFKLGLLKLVYFSWFARGVVNALFRGTPTDTLYTLGTAKLDLQGEAVVKNIFFEHFKKEPIAGCLTLRKGNVEIKLWHLPSTQSIFFGRNIVLEGSLNQLADYIEVPLQEKFDIIFIDGRARVSCIKRSYVDSLLSAKGTLFVHDGFRPELLEAYRLFSSSLTFINGSNKTLNGGHRCIEEMSVPFVRTGRDMDSLEQSIMQELFVYRNENG